MLPALFVPKVIVSVAPPLVDEVKVVRPTAMLRTAEAELLVTFIACSAVLAFIAVASDEAIDDNVSPPIVV
jgi:hypothetical protein